MKTCANCGGANLDDAQFCQSCGRSLAGTEAAPLAPSMFGLSGEQPPPASPTQGPPAGGGASPMMKCPYCAEQIPSDATTCPLCRSGLGAGPAIASPVPAYPPPIPVATSGMAIASLVLGILGLAGIGSVLAVIFGHVALSKIRRSGGRLKGAGMALAGLILGYVVISIILLAAIAIPNLLRARMAANEASAVGALRQINSACVQYDSDYKGYPASLANLRPNPYYKPDRDAADLIDSVLAGGLKSGYTFQYEATDKDRYGRANGYQVWADPVNPGTTGQRHFFTDQTGVIRAEMNRRASAESPPLS